MPTDQTKRKELWGRWVAALCARDLRRAEEVAEEMCDQDYVVHNPKLPDYGRGPAAAGPRLVTIPRGHGLVACSSTSAFALRYPRLLETGCG